MSAREWKPGEPVHIYPDDREQVEQLGKAFHESDHIAPWHDLHNETRVQIVDDLTYALRAVAGALREQQQPAALFIQSDGRDMTVWHDRPDRDPEALLTEHQAGPVLWAHLVATLPTRDEPQPEPLDPAVRVIDRDGGEWARVDDAWLSPGNSEAGWDDLTTEHGPLTIVTPTPEPTPDERPFVVGDRVRVADDATWANGGVSPALTRIRGGEARVVDSCLAGPGNAAVLRDGCIAHVAARFLTHADADAPC